MNMSGFQLQKRIGASLIAMCFLCVSVTAHSEEREDLERLRATVLGLIDTLVKSGVIPKNKADAMMREAEANAQARLAQMSPPEVGVDGKKIVRVPYVPEAVKVQMREQIKAEVLAETKSERAKENGPLASSSLIRVEGDLRLRGEMARLNSSNSPATAYESSASLIRAPDFLSLGGPGKDLHTFDPQQGYNRERVRARLGVSADVSDWVTASISLATGSTSGPTSTNQTIGQGTSQTPGFFNKYGAVIDRASIEVKPVPALILSGGRFRSPFVGTDLLWADDLNFEGFSVKLKPQAVLQNSFLTLGWFPLASNIPNQSRGRNLLGVQTGVNWQIGQKENWVKLAAAVYDFHNIAGVQETQSTYQSNPLYVVQSEYGAGYRQRGNTLFRINAPASIDPNTNWGLASNFRELDLLGTVDVGQFDPVHVILTGDFVKNLKFDRNDINKRINGGSINTGTSTTLLDGKSVGYLAKVQVGYPTIAAAGDWNVSAAYRYLGSDAVVDAFTNSDFGLGGTNTKGTIIGGNFGVGKNTWLSAKWMSSNLIDSIMPATSATPKSSKFATDVFQLDLNTKF